MAKDLLDFSKFKKIFEDDKNTHLQHPKGHTIIVAHVALSPKLKKQIADLPMHPEKMVELAKDIMEQMPHHKMAEGGGVKSKKGSKGDWQKEGYTIHYTTPETRGAFAEKIGSPLVKEGNVNGDHTIWAVDPTGKKVGHLDIDNEQGNGMFALETEIDPEHQRKGLASAMYRLAEQKTGRKFSPSPHQTGEGEALWNQPDRAFGNYAEGGEAKPFKGYNKEKHARTGGLNDAYREKYNREHGSNLKRPVTGTPEPGSKDAARKKSFCARMKGVKGPTSEGGELTPKGAALKRWNCHAHGGKIEGDHDEECVHYAEGGNVEKPAVSRLDMHYKDVTKRIPQLTEAANKILSGEMSSAEYDALVNKHKPVEAYGFVPQPATREEAVKALGKKGEKYGKTGHINVGHPTELRLDIPAYRDHGVWINSIHPLKSDNTRDEAVYDSVSSVKNAKMIGAPKQAIKVASGAANKSPFAVIRGEWNPIKEKEAVAKAQKYLKHPEWRQVGYDPERHGYFYDRENMHPIESAEEVLQIGPLVLAKKPVYGKKHEQLFADGGDVEMYAKGGKAEKARVFGERGDPSNKELRAKQIAAASELAQRRYGMPIVPSKGKIIDEETGERKQGSKAKSPKPDWRSGELESEQTSQAAIHELAHLEQLPPGMGLKVAQAYMDEGSARAGKLYKGAAKQIQEEIQPMAMENPLRRRAGLPAFGRPQSMSPIYGESSKVPLSWEHPPRVSADTGEEYATRVAGKKGQPLDLIAQSKNLSDQYYRRLMDVDQGITKFKPETGWQEAMSPHALINLRGQGRMGEAEERLRTRGESRFGDEDTKPWQFAEGGQVGFDAIKKERYYADGGRVMLQSGGDPNDPNKPLTLPSYADPNLTPWQSADVAPSPSPTPEYHGGYNNMGDERHFASSDARGEVSLPQRFHRQNIVQTESGGRQFDTAGAPTTGKSGEIGASQIMPEMAPKFAGQTGMEWNPELFYRRKTGDYGKDYETEQYNLDLGAKAFNHLYDKYEGDMAKTIAAYNAGEPTLNAAIEKAQREGGSWLDHVPPRTRRYVYENLAREEGIPNPHEFATKKAGMAQDVSSPEESYYDETSAKKPEEQWTPLPDDSEELEQRRQEAAQTRDADVRRKVQSFYNQEMIMLSSGEDIGVPARPVDPSLLFGPNGEPPKTLDPDVLDRAEKRYVAIRQREIQKQQAEQTKLQKENLARARMNLPPKPMPGAPAYAPVTRGAVSTDKMSPYEQQIVGEGPAKERLPTDTMGADLLGPQSRYAEGMAEQIAGTRKIYDAQRAAAKESIQPIDENVRAKQALYEKTLKTQQALEDYHAQITNALMDPRNQVDPMKVWKDKSTLGKISSAVGLLIGGMGGGLMKQENPAYRFLKDQIDASVEAQKANLGRYDNLLKTNIQAMQQTQAGAEMLRAQLGEIVTKQIEAAVKRYEDPRLQGEMEKAVGGIKMGLVTTPLQKAAFMKLAYDPATTEQQLDSMLPTVQALFPDLYDEITKRRVPGYGVATIRPLTLDEQSQIKSANTFIQNAGRLERLVNEYKRAIAIDPTPSAEKARAISMMAGLVADLAKAHGAEPSEGAMGWLESQLGSPTSIKDAIWTGQAKLGATIEEMKGRKRANLQQAFSKPVVESMMRRDEIHAPEYAPTTTESKEAAKRQLLAPPR